MKRAIAALVLAFLAVAPAIPGTAATASPPAPAHTQRQVVLGYWTRGWHTSRYVAFSTSVFEVTDTAVIVTTHLPLRAPGAAGQQTIAMTVSDSHAAFEMSAADGRRRWDNPRGCFRASALVDVARGVVHFYLPLTALRAAGIGRTAWISLQAAWWSGWGPHGRTAVSSVATPEQMLLSPNGATR